MVSAAMSMKRILVLSSDPTACHAATAALCGEFSVYASPCGDGEVLKMMSRMRPQVVICDVQLVRAASAAARLLGTGGGDLRGQDLSAHSTTVELPPSEEEVQVLALVGKGAERRILSVFDEGAHDYVITPVLERELKDKVRALLGEDDDLAADSSTHHNRAREGFGAELPPPLMPSKEREREDGALPSVVGRYELGEILGQGGYGVVYKAWDRSANRAVALKMLPREANDQPESVARFFRESSAIGRLAHPNIVRFHEFDSFQGRFYFTMEIVEGIDLKDLTDAESPFDVTRAARYVVQVAKAIEAISGLGFVHRDVKPENMLLCKDGTVKLIDFGLVKMLDAATITCDNDVLGTPYYMGPEYIAGGQALDVKYDIYSLGVTFYVFLTGQYPFTGRNTAHVLEKHLRERPPHVRDTNPLVPQGIDALIYRMMSKRPNQRPSPNQLVAELIHLLGEEVLQPAR